MLPRPAVNHSPSAAEMDRSDGAQTRRRGPSQRGLRWAVEGVSGKVSFFSLHLNSIYVKLDSMDNLGHESVRVLYPAVCHVCYACPAPSGWHVSRPLKRDKYSEERMINDEE